MTAGEVRAARLPVGSQIRRKPIRDGATGEIVTRLSDWADARIQRWQGDGVYWGERDIDSMLDDGAEVLRVNDGSAV